MRFFVEIRRRGLLKVAVGYLGVSWLTLEIGHTLFLIFELPHLGLQLIFALLVIGFPLALFATWHGWLGATLQQSEPAPAEHGGAHAGAGHEGAWHAAIFGLLVVLVIAIAIGLRFRGMQGGGHEAGAQPAGESPARADNAARPAAAAFSPPPHSVAVLPFVNMSGDPKQDYFSDGLSEELLNSLTSIADLHVAARSSSFLFKGEKVDVAELSLIHI